MTQAIVMGSHVGSSNHLKPREGMKVACVIQIDGTTHAAQRAAFEVSFLITHFALRRAGHIISIDTMKLYLELK